jgi:hypothetical protein
MAVVVVCGAGRRHLCFDLDVTFDAEYRFEIRPGDHRALFSGRFVSAVPILRLVPKHACKNQVMTFASHSHLGQQSASR